MRIAIIGTGNVGAAVARGLKGKGHAVTLGARRPDTPEVRATAEAAGALPSGGHSPVGSGSSFGASNSGPKGTPWVGRHTFNAVPSAPRTFPSSARILSSKV